LYKSYIWLQTNIVALPVICWMINHKAYVFR